MAERLNINKIDKNTEEWTCKVQVVDKGHPRTNREGNKKYQLMILQDEEDILALVINGSPPSYASNGSRIQEFIIIDYHLWSNAFTGYLM
ncbi:hypothetical protein KY290_012185 [Solanum tuberosum]|uniref:Uncharacterized protein n=1 Tax=Solanum tuberosum TaxID=4113 RepID=A0ABQ7W4Q6_SOLTU|nr:hypothetical protein KY290_012185 [Solanum tuberosum]